MHDDVVQQLGRQILAGLIRPGDRVPSEIDVGVSRTAYRESLRVLGAKGLIESRPNYGTRVRTRQDWNLLDPDVLSWHTASLSDASLLRDLVELRQILEPQAARLAAERADAAGIREMTVAFSEMNAAIDNRAAFITADMRFHDAIFRAGGNELMQRVNQLVRAAFLSSRLATSQTAPAASSMPQHRKVLEAIRAHRPAAAERAMRTLLLQVVRDMKRYLKQLARPSE